jgi:hypothetical protein
MTPSNSATNRATVKLHKGLYAAEAIREAAGTFADFAAFSIRSEGAHFVVDIADIDREVEGDVVAEFCNFALANTALRSRSVV